jgi:hypothetical protein
MCSQRVAARDVSGDKRADVRMSDAALLSVTDDEARIFSCKFPGVAHLAARLGVEGRAVEHHFAFIARI